MDKKKQLQFNLNNFLLSITLALDLKEKDIYKTSRNHTKRVAYLSLKLGQKYDLSNEEMADLCSYSLIHNIALNKEKEYNKEHFILANKSASKLPFLCDYENVLKYQNEYYNGSGLFGKKDDEIPFFSQILSFVHLIDTKFDLNGEIIKNKKEIIDFLEKNENVLFSSDLLEKFLDISSTVDFWLDMQSENDILYFIFSSLSDFTITPTFEEILSYTSVFMNLNDENKNLLDRCLKTTKLFAFEHKDEQTFLIAASLYNIGKLIIPERILKKSDKLSNSEYEEIKAYPYYTKKILSNIIGFNDITVWASSIQETIDGQGYPFRLSGKNLTLKDRLIAILNVYQSLRTKKTYRDEYSHKESIKIMLELANNTKLDKSIVEDVVNILE